MAARAAKHRFIVESAVLAGDDVRVEGEFAHQISRVLRLRTGEQIVLLDGSGSEAEVELQVVTPKLVTGTIQAIRRSPAEPRVSITLYQALLQRDKMEVVLQKGTEVGISTFVPVVSQRSLIGRGGGVDERRLERWRRIVREAAEQSRRGHAPEIRGPISLEDAFAEATTTGTAIVAWENERERSLRTALGEIPTGVALSLFVGPEGGFAEDEIALAERSGALTVSLGPRILRTETAGPVLAALVLYEYGDLEPRCADRSAS
jgi:16S rRNA (uracil1498-N3)-methyltransferase